MKQMDTQKEKIGEATFYIRKFPAFTAANISGELSAVVAPLLSGILPLISGGAGNFGDMDIEEAAPLLMESLSSLSGDKIEHLAKRLLIDYKNVSVSCNETDGDVELLTLDLANEIFCGELQDMLISA